MPNRSNRWATLVAGVIITSLTASCSAGHRSGSAETDPATPALAPGSTVLSSPTATSIPSTSAPATTSTTERSQPPTSTRASTPRSVASTVPIATTKPAAPKAVRSKSGPSIAGCPVFPADNAWNTDISHLPVDPHSAAWLANSGGPNRLIHPDFGDSGTSVPYGIPFVVTNSSHPRVRVTFQYSSESDPGPYPFGPDTPIEGGAGSGGDQHAIMLDSSTCTLYELYDANYSAQGSTAGSGAIWNLRSDALRPSGWTSADAAGLPILPGLLRQDEVNAGFVGHAIRMTVETTDNLFIWPARHQAGSVDDLNYPPMGARFRLNASVDISHFSRDTQVVLTAMKHYGLIVADNGSNWYFQGAAQPGWDNTMLDELKTIPVSDFEAVDTSSLMIDPNSGAARSQAVSG
jgi:hypothetical protein